MLEKFPPGDIRKELQAKAFSMLKKNSLSKDLNYVYFPKCLAFSTLLNSQRSKIKNPSVAIRCELECVPPIQEVILA